MLVLSRKKNESIIIDQEIRITVVEIRGDKVRLGIEAPKEVPVHRSEIHDAIRSERAAEERDLARGERSAQPANPDLT
jgi:carbon storage regulator